MRSTRSAQLCVTVGLLVTAWCGSAAAAYGASPATAPDELEDDLVVLCTVTEDWCQAAVDAFSEVSGVSTTHLRLSAGEAIARLQGEGDSPSFDVWFGGPSVGPSTAALDGLIEPYVSPEADVIPAEWKNPDGLWTGIYLGAIGLCSNAEYLDELGVEAPTSWAELLDPAFDNAIAMADQRTSGTAIIAGAAIVRVEGSVDAALDYFQELDANILQYTKSGSAPGNMAAQGEIAVAVIFSHDCVGIAEETGVDLITTFPEEGTGFEVGQVSVLANAEHPTAARAFIDWALTAEAQAIAPTAAAYQIPTNPATPVPEQSVDLADIVFADGFTTEFAEELAASDFAERFALEVRGGQDAPTD